ncbi:MAG: recombinase family protein [Magnetospirillum sp.]|nr:recombinase family protein [Magnetospirillum sp.]
MIVGYFRRIDSSETMAPAALLRAERCLRIETDAPGRREARSALLADLGSGDVLVSPSIAHLAESATDLLGVVSRVHRAGATLRLAAERIDTSIAAARNALVAVAEYDRRQQDERRRKGRTEAELRGAPLGRPRKLDDVLLRTIREDLAQGHTYASVARSVGVHPTTIMRMVRRADGQTEG